MINNFLVWLDSFDFMTYKKKEKLFELSQSPLDFLNKDMWVKNKDKISTFLKEDDYNILLNSLNEKNIELVVKSVKDLKINYVCLFDKNYPQSLKNIDTPPYVLYYKGDLSILNELCIAVVGSRHITSYGKMVTEKFVKDLCQSNFVIISGLASGVDTVAHTVSLAQNAKTVAVLAGGLYEIYPPTNTNLAKQIVESGGLILSETPPYKRTESYMFPIRNRIIAALSQGVLITEAQEKSGVIHTKNYALDYGKDVFAVPGSIFSQNCVGTNRMIVNGQAKAVVVSEDILCEYNIDLEKKQKFTYNFTLEESLIVNLLKQGEKSFQELVLATKLETKTLNSLLTTLLIRGIIKKLAGNIYFLAV